MKRDFFRYFRSQKRMAERDLIAPSASALAPAPGLDLSCPDLPITKADLRRRMKERLSAMSLAERCTASLHICQRAAELAAFERAARIAFFAPLPSEPDITPLIEEAWAEGKEVALPCIVLKHETKEKILEWRLLQDWDELIKGGLPGLREPDPHRTVVLNPALLDCIFVPGLAFDPTGTRLGRGGGFYDRFLAQVSDTTPCPGLMFACQQIAKIPADPHDLRLRCVITEAGCQVLD